MSENPSPQSVRLKRFIDETGYSVFEFGKQCDIPSSKTMSDIIVKGKVPSPKVLDKIVNRFPQLNHDWVVLGYGEMIVKGIQNQPTDAHSLQKSQTATYQNIEQYLQNHDFAINELANMIKKAMIANTETLNTFHNKIALYEEKMSKVSDQITQSVEEGKKVLHEQYMNYRHFMDTHRKTAVKQIKEALANQDQKRWDYIHKADKKREKIANELMDRIDSNWIKYKNKIDKDIAHSITSLRSIFKEILESSSEDVKADFKKNSDANTKKAMDFVSKIGSFQKHSNPKPQK